VNFCNWFFVLTSCSSTLKVIPIFQRFIYCSRSQRKALGRSGILIILLLFFFAGLYYHISKRAAGIHYVFIGKPSNQRPRYGVLYQKWIMVSPYLWWFAFFVFFSFFSFSWPSFLWVLRVELLCKIVPISFIIMSRWSFFLLRHISFLIDRVNISRHFLSTQVHFPWLKIGTWICVCLLNAFVCLAIFISWWVSLVKFVIWFHEEITTDRNMLLILETHFLLFLVVTVWIIHVLCWVA